MLKLLQALAFIVFGLQISNVSFADSASVEGKNCQPWPEVLKNMPIGEATFELGSERTIEFSFRMANTGKRSQHGFQFTCAETIENTKIMFYFKRPIIPSFHMNNVVAPLDIAFIDQEGKIIDILLMKTYSFLELNKPLYKPTSPALYALEAKAGFFKEEGIQVGDMILFKNVNN